MSHACCACSNIFNYFVVKLHVTALLATFQILHSPHCDIAQVLNCPDAFLGMQGSEAGVAEVAVVAGGLDDQEPTVSLSGAIKGLSHCTAGLVRNSPQSQKLCLTESLSILHTHCRPANYRIAALEFCTSDIHLDRGFR